MCTIAVMNEQGGSGKTTTTISLAAALAERGLSVLVVDLDPQASASLWLGRGREPGLIELTSEPGINTAQTIARGRLRPPVEAAKCP